ncbi:MAG: biotin--[acetyl-CoA-carboxylase] ligase [Prevotellaceae bacterium]|jgi:BirA family biotin operon repressor/biotin-[acetyl-CoA-carboxylase] ligase|nr:biotin--[acetyl-CoA-carboxylase] ligase [Prevotellaceae bacterium]
MIQKLQTINSTSAYLSGLLKNSELPDRYCVCADFQTSGRGQAGSWEAENGKNLLFSFYLKTDKIPLQSQFLLSEIVALGILSALKKYLPEIKIKWANDIFYQDKKLCGILVEPAVLGNKMKHAVVGIGLNVNQSVFLQNSETATSLKIVLQRDFDLNAILEEILMEIFSLYDHFSTENSAELQKNYFENLYRNSGFHFFEAYNEIFKAKVLSVNSDGRLNLLTNNGLERNFYFKEVKFLI